MARKVILALVIAIGLATLGSLFVARLRYSHQELKTCFDDAEGLRTGASVRIAGVDVGIVRSVRANPQNKACPAEVEMDIATTYELKIPRDSVARPAQGGLLGPTYVDLDVTHSTGPPIENYGYLSSKTRQ